MFVGSGSNGTSRMKGVVMNLDRFICGHLRKVTGYRLWTCLMVCCLVTGIVDGYQTSINTSVTSHRQQPVTNTASEQLTVVVVVAKPDWFHRLFSRPTWEQVISECRTPEDVCRMTQRYLGYRKVADHWGTAEEIWKRETSKTNQSMGACAEMAIVELALCHQLGFDAEIYFYYPTIANGPGHAIVVGKQDGQLWMSSNGSYNEVSSQADVTARVAHILWVKPDGVWSLKLTNDNVEELTTGSAPIIITLPDLARINVAQ